MRNIQKQLCGIAVMLFGLIITVASFWNQDDDEKKEDGEDNT